MKKLFGVFVFGVLMFSMSLSFVSAGFVEQIQDGVTDAYSVVEPVLKYIVGDNAGSPELFFAKILLAIIIFSVVWMALGKIPFFQGNDWSMWTVGIAVSLLAIRWVGDAGVVRTIILPYSALGVALTAGIPFVVYFLVVKDFHKTLRKISWIFFIVIFIALWIMRAGEVAEGTAATVGGPVGAFAWIYLATAGLAVVALLLDGTIQKLMTKAKIERIQSAHSNTMVGDLRDEMKKITERYKTDGDKYTSIYTTQTGGKGYRGDMDKIKEMIATLKSE